MDERIALVAGATGIVGRNLVGRLTQEPGWRVLAMARRPLEMAGSEALPADLTNAVELRDRLKDHRPTHVFFTSWLRQATEAENIRVNAGMIRNLLDALQPAGSVQHVALVTGLKHYLGPFEAYGKGSLPQTPFREEQERLPVENFYYAQEDELFRAAARDGFGWSVHRPHTIIGFAVGNAMNMGITLAVYATLCRETGKPFVFPGSEMQWKGLTDMTDAGLLADHLMWAATTPAARNQAFNVVNGDVFRWQWMWAQLAEWFGIEPAPFAEEPSPLVEQFAAMDAARLWREIAAKYQLAESDIDKLTSAWHTDADLGRPIEVVTDMSSSRRLGFLEYRPTNDSFFSLFERLRAERLIP